MDIISYSVRSTLIARTSVRYIRLLHKSTILIVAFISFTVNANHRHNKFIQLSFGAFACSSWIKLIVVFFVFHSLDGREKFHCRGILDNSESTTQIQMAHAAEVTEVIIRSRLS